MLVSAQLPIKFGCCPHALSLLFYNFNRFLLGRYDPLSPVKCAFPQLIRVANCV